MDRRPAVDRNCLHRTLIDTSRQHKHGRRCDVKGVHAPAARYSVVDCVGAQGPASNAQEQGPRLRSPALPLTRVALDLDFMVVTSRKRQRALV